MVSWNVDNGPNSGRNCFGRFSREAGHSRVPAPPHMMRGTIGCTTLRSPTSRRFDAPCDTNRARVRAVPRDRASLTVERRCQTSRASRTHEGREPESSIREEASAPAGGSNQQVSVLLHVGQCHLMDGGHVMRNFAEGDLLMRLVRYDQSGGRQFCMLVMSRHRAGRLIAGRQPKLRMENEGVIAGIG